MNTLVKIINSWAQGIISAVIITTIIEIILPEGNNKKYIKVILGIYILFSVIYPVINSISDKSINLDTVIKSTSKQMEKYENNSVAIETNSYIENTYKKNLTKNITDNLEEKGYRLKNLNLYIETQNEEKYGQINNIVLEIEKHNKKENAQDNKINEVNIVVSSKKTEEKIEPISEDEIKNLKEYFVNSYSIEKERIHINE